MLAIGHSSASWVRSASSTIKRGSKDRSRSYSAISAFQQ
jgi:hypothetical protein